MAPLTVTVDRHTYSFTPDDNDLATRRHRAIVRGRLVDELTGQPPRAAAELSVAERGCVARVAEDGLFGLVGRPWLACNPLLAPSLRVTLSIRAAGFLPIELPVNIPFDRRELTAAAARNTNALALDDASGLAVGQRLLVGDIASPALPGAPHADIEELAEIVALGNPGPHDVLLRGPLRFDHPVHALVAPEAFAAADLLDLELHRAPVVIHGRTLQRTNAGLVAVPNVHVGVTEVWRRPPPPAGGVPPEAAAVVALDPPLAADWPAATAWVTVRDLPADPTVPGKRLLADVEPGSRTLPLSDLAGLAAGDILIVDGGDAAHVEFARAQSFAGAAAASEPGVAVVDEGLVRGHSRDARVYRAAPQPRGVQKTLVRDARIGDPCVFLNDITGIGGPHDVELSIGGAAPFAYRRLTVLAATSDWEGWYRFPPLTRIGQMTLRASAPPPPGPPALADRVVTFLPDYAETENRLDIVFQ
jgi:hypothetical protein